MVRAAAAARLAAPPQQSSSLTETGKPVSMFGPVKAMVRELSETLVFCGDRKKRGLG
jgi:hypothetical protein